MFGGFFGNAFDLNHDGKLDHTEESIGRLYTYSLFSSHKAAPVSAKKETPHTKSITKEQVALIHLATVLQQVTNEKALPYFRLASVLQQISDSYRMEDCP